jgi:hypothetical protein
MATALDGLFDAGPYVVEQPELEPATKVSPDRRRTIRQAAAIARGGHPLALAFTTIRMHPDADRSASRTDRLVRSIPLRCGSCRFRQLFDSGEHSGTFWKCMYRNDNPTDSRPDVDPFPRVSFSGATDVRAWWPACTDYTAGDQLVSDDAARWFPDFASPGQAASRP